MSYQRPSIIFVKPYFLLLVFVLFGCNSETSRSQKEAVLTAQSNFSDQVKINHAKGFNIAYHQNYKLVSIVNPFEKTADTTRYMLLKKGASRPAGFEKVQVIEIPVEKLVATSSMHVALLEFLESGAVITGISSPQYIYSPKILDMVKAGEVVDVGQDQGLNEEKLVEMHPDVVMAMGSPGAKTDPYRILAQAGIPVLINSEWVEKTPLARAEWVKLMAALVNQEKLVNEKFGQIEAEYFRLAKLAREIKSKPSVISGLNSKDAWFLPSGDGYMSQFFKDAGGIYHWNDTKATGSIPLSFESVYPVALQADVWLNVGFDKNDKKADILAQDSRYSDFKAFKSGQMYSYNARVNDAGANDFFESGTMNPQIVLADLIKVLHPELLPEHTLVYYKQLK